MAAYTRSHRQHKLLEQSAATETPITINDMTTQPEDTTAEDNQALAEHYASDDFADTAAALEQIIADSDD